MSTSIEQVMADGMRRHAAYHWPSPSGVDAIRRANFLALGRHLHGETCDYLDWTGERIIHEVGCPYFNIQDDTVPCDCTIVTGLLPQQLPDDPPPPHSNRIGDYRRG